MKGGRKNLKRAVEAEIMALQQGQSIMQVVDLRGSNLIEVEIFNVPSLVFKLKVILPINSILEGNGRERTASTSNISSKKSMWIKRGNFVVVDETGRDEAIESGRKVAGMVTQVLYHDQLRLLQKSYEWPEIFKSSSPEISKQGLQLSASQDDDECRKDDECSSDDDEGLPPLKANTNRVNPLLLHLDEESTSDSDIENDS